MKEVWKDISGYNGIYQISGDEYNSIEKLVR